jgi:hypothetical protein
MGDQEQQLGGLLASQLTALELGKSQGQSWVAEVRVAAQLLVQLGSVGGVGHESLLPRGHHRHLHLPNHSS